MVIETRDDPTTATNAATGINAVMVADARAGHDKTIDQNEMIDQTTVAPTAVDPSNATGREPNLDVTPNPGMPEMTEAPEITEKNAIAVRAVIPNGPTLVIAETIEASVKTSETDVTIARRREAKTTRHRRRIATIAVHKKKTDTLVTNTAKTVKSPRMIEPPFVADR